ncbi:uncharacterized protein LOC128996178 [Macrosteles quadrilineatus]|uniref:uncharacterized protein LOC128996178 n=1 Tax=Macrosteles quadrilineatus TaxID=74068 RepID=UPI0023E09E54|nr:uncharacterized protein LOC128996178 [Macrosteles quadrilineatus]
MFLRCLLLSSACLVAAQGPEGTTHDMLSSSDTPGVPSSTDIEAIMDYQTPEVLDDSTTNFENVTMTEEPSSSESPRNVTSESPRNVTSESPRRNVTSTTEAPSPSKGGVVGVWSATSLAFLAVAVMS